MILFFMDIPLKAFAINILNIDKNYLRFPQANMNRSHLLVVNEGWKNAPYMTSMFKSLTKLINN